MATQLNLATYPFDPTGRLANNKITGEQHVITGANFRDYHFIVPKLAPYFAESLVVTYRDTNNLVRTLVEGIDYYTTHQFISASRATAAPVYGSISFLDVMLTGVISIEYQTIGGIWTQDDQAIAEILADRLNNPRTTSWDVVVDMPVSFPVINHEWDLADMVGASAMVESLGEIETALRQTGDVGMNNHIVSQSNPHNVTAAQAGLGLVRNLTTADTLSAQTGVSDDLYMTPKSTADAISHQVSATLTAHINSTNNPHNVTAAQVGSYSIQDIDLMLTDYLRINQAASDTVKFDGLSAFDFKDWVLSGTAANSLKFNGMTYGDMYADVLSGTAANSMLLEGRTYAQVIGAAGATTSTNSTLFDGNTYAEVKADFLDEKIADSFKLDGKTYVEVIAAARTGTVTNSTRFDGRTFAQATTEILAGTAANATLFDGRTWGQVVASLSSLDAENALKFDGKSFAEVVTIILGNTASNSNKLEGKTYAEVIEGAQGGTAVNSDRLGGLTSTEYADYLEPRFGKAKTSSQYRLHPQTTVDDPALTPDSWTPLATVAMAAVSAEQVADACWFVTGGEVMGTDTTSVYLVQAKFRDTVSTDLLPSLKVYRLSGDSSDGVNFAMTVDAGVATLWHASSSVRKELTISTVSQGASVLLEPDVLTHVFVEPVSAYVPQAIEQYVTDVTLSNTLAGTLVRITDAESVIVGLDSTNSAQSGLIADNAAALALTNASVLTHGTRLAGHDSTLLTIASDIATLQTDVGDNATAITTQGAVLGDQIDALSLSTEARLDSLDAETLSIRDDYVAALAQQNIDLLAIIAVLQADIADLQAAVNGP